MDSYIIAIIQSSMAYASSTRNSERSRSQRRRRAVKTVVHHSSEATLTDVDSEFYVNSLCKTLIPHSCGNFSKKCQQCQAMFFPSERSYNILRNSVSVVATEKFSCGRFMTQLTRRNRWLIC